jgi:hypothetical protein
MAIFCMRLAFNKSNAASKYLGKAQKFGYDELPRPKTENL